jgi:hypothetical protein
VETAKRVVELYELGKGTRIISELTHVPRTSVRRILARAGIYAGKERVQQPAVVTPAIVEPAGSPLDPSSWAAAEATVKRDGLGWLIGLHGLYAQMICPLPTSTIGKTTRWSAAFTLVSPMVGSCELGIGDTDGADTIAVVLQRMVEGSRWHIVRDVRGPRPRLWLKGNQHNGQVIRVSDITTNLR